MSDDDPVSRAVAHNRHLRDCAVIARIIDGMSLVDRVKERGPLVIDWPRVRWRVYRLNGIT